MGLAGPLPGGRELGGDLVGLRALGECGDSSSHSFPARRRPVAAEPDLGCLCPSALSPQLPHLHLLHSVISYQVGQASAPFSIVPGPDLSDRAQGCRRPSWSPWRPSMFLSGPGGLVSFKSRPLIF